MSDAFAFRFRAMGTTVTMLGPADDPAFEDAARQVQDRFTAEEQRFSRFRADSELSRVNARAGTPTRVSAPFAALTRLALNGAAATGGRFDPTVHDALVAAGYDRDFDELIAGARGALHAATPCGRWAEAEVDDRTLTLPAGIHLDLGGIAKGWTADRAAEDAIAAGLPWVVVNAGGDLRIAGAAPSLEVGVEDPEAPRQEMLRLRLGSGGVATSSIAKRTWAPGVHHVIDPSTGRPAETELLQATVWAEDATHAEIYATDALLLGVSAADRYPAVLVAHDGDVLSSMPTEEAV
jgi:thiamine biosynthesis lipoprotein